MVEINAEQRNSARVQISVPIRVLSFDLEDFETGGFSEDTRTLGVSRSGASITLRNPVCPWDFLRIINLANHKEADFRVVGMIGVAEGGAVNWAVECLERREDFWGVDSPPPPSPGCYEGTIHLKCRSCDTKINHSLTFVELEVFDSTGVILLYCDVCSTPTYWVDADPNRPLRVDSPAELVAPPPRAGGLRRTIGNGEKTEHRSGKRSSLKFSILVRNRAGDQELSRTIDVSKSGAGVSLFMKLNVGDVVEIICPYDPRSGGIKQTAEVRWRSQYYNQDFPRAYGLRYIR